MWGSSYSRTGGVMVNRLVLVEGLSGTGKSTTAHLLPGGLATAFPATWFYEQVFPHPVPYLRLKGPQ